jgi:hypothetical protein
MRNSMSGWWLGALTVIGAGAIGCRQDAPTAPGPALVKGSKPGSNTNTGITPIKLGNLKTIGCSSAEVYAISSAASPLVVGMGYGCGRPSEKPFIWSGATGLAATGNSPGKYARAVSDNGVIVGLGATWGAAVFDMAGNPSPLPLPAGVTWAEGTGVTPDGRVVVGYGGDNSATWALRWQRASPTAAWQVGEKIGLGNARGVAENGTSVVGASDGHPVLWRRSGSGWTTVPLPEGEYGGAARAINRAGTLVAGITWIPLARDPSVEIDVHTVWVNRGGDNWEAQVLKGTDPNFDEGGANGIADQGDGGSVVVGYSWEDASGPSGIPWAVAWRRKAGEAAFGPAIRLQPINTTWGASAYGVNNRGEVVGGASTGKGTVPVIWKLPPP